MPKHDDKANSINTGGGVFIGGNVTVGGDVVGGDKISISGSGNVIAGSSIKGMLRANAEEYVLAELRDRLIRSFSLAELELLSFDFGADWDSLSGNSLQTKARSLIAYAWRRGELDKLIRTCTQLRPDVDWNILPNQELSQVIKETTTQAVDHLRVFLAYTSIDIQEVQSLYRRLKNDGFDIWLDSESITPGEDWAAAIAEALQSSDVIIFVLSPEARLSKSTSSMSELALKQSSGDHQGSIFIVPLLLQPTELPETLKEFQTVNYYEEGGYKDLVRALRRSAANLGISPTTRS
jgi:hypothetical protein